MASEHRPKTAFDESEENVIPKIQPDEEFIKTAGINKRPGVPLGLRFAKTPENLFIAKLNRC